MNANSYRWEQTIDSIYAENQLCDQARVTYGNPYMSEAEIS